MNTPASGKVVFLFTDIEGSTRLAQLNKEAIPELLAKHNSILQNSVETNDGFVFKVIGDAFCCSFDSFEKAANAAVMAQRALAGEELDGTSVKVRMGLHFGYAEWNGNDYMGYLTLARANRIMSAAHGGQIVASGDAVDLFLSDSDCIRDFRKEGEIISINDLGERRLKDLIEPVKIYQLVAEGLHGEFPPINTLDLRPNNLPVQLSSFIGRTEELKALYKMIIDHRILTVTGPGGTGKTRFTLQASAELIDRFENGVWLVELASLSNRSSVYDEAASIFTIAPQPGKEMSDAVVDYLKNKELLIILDNCEHLVTASSAFCENILKKCPKVKILATSREALHCYGERTFPLNPLEYPGSKDRLTPEQLIGYESVRLFVERALSVNNSFRINDANVKAVQMICSHLDGIPLALELAAARLRVLSAEVLSNRLNERFKILTGGKRTSMPRQQTLKAMIDWSYDLLDEKEKLLFGRLSVFKGGWTLEAAESVCSDDTIEEFEVMDLLSALLDKSLVTSRENESGIRFGMLQTIREYATSVATEPDTLNEKLCRYILQILESFNYSNTQSVQDELVLLADREKENIRSAISWAMENDNETAYMFIRTLIDYWQHKGGQKEALEYCSVLIDKAKLLSQDQITDLMYWKGISLYNMGDQAEAEEIAGKVYLRYTETGNELGIAFALNYKGVLSNMKQHSEESAQCFRKAIELFRKHSSTFNIANALNNLSFAVSDSVEKLKLKLEALALFRELKSSHSIAAALTGIGNYYLSSGQVDKALEHTRESLEICSRMDYKYLLSANHVNIGCIYLSEGNFAEAYSHLDESEKIADEFGFMGNIVPIYHYKGEVRCAEKNFHEAVLFYARSIKMGIGIYSDFFLFNSLASLVRSFCLMENFGSAAEFYSYLKCLTDLHGYKNKKPLGFSMNEIAEIVISRIDSDEFTGMTDKLAALSKEELFKRLEVAVDGIINAQGVRPEQPHL